MSETIHTAGPKTKTKPASGSAASAFEFPKFEIPNFEVPKMEIPAAFREFAEKSVSQAKDNYEKMKTSAEEATDVLEDTYTNASEGAFYKELMTVKSFSEVIELSTTHARKQFETVTSQTKDLAALAQKVAVETTEPFKESVSKTFSKVA